jgi:glycerol-1-phosphate dehydrogenase [NAD(P)+]
MVQMTDRSPGTLETALASARDTKALKVGVGAIESIAELFKRQFGDRSSVIIADASTFAAAGAAVQSALLGSGIKQEAPIILDAASQHADHAIVTRLEQALAAHNAIPIAVGSGTINDLTKLSAHRAGRAYLSVATAASMDGYSAFGASITFNGSKQTFDCPAPQAILVDLRVIAKAPRDLNAAGFADLVAKVTAGADWILADELGVEPIDRTAWGLVHDRFREWTSDPAGVWRADVEALRCLVEGLLVSGFAMQASRSSRPASGAEHQFSHLWDMQHHTYHGEAPWHGFKVGIASLAVARLYEQVLNRQLESLDVDLAVARWPDLKQADQEIRQLLPEPALAEKARLEMHAKHVSKAVLRDQLLLLRSRWPAIKERLGAHLLPSTRLAEMLGLAGAPTSSQDIGISPARLRESFRQAYFIRRRFTILDLIERAGIFDSSVAECF